MAFLFHGKQVVLIQVIQVVINKRIELLEYIMTVTLQFKAMHLLKECALVYEKQLLLILNLLLMNKSQIHWLVKRFYKLFELVSLLLVLVLHEELVLPFNMLDVGLELYVITRLQSTGMYRVHVRLSIVFVIVYDAVSKG